MDLTIKINRDTVLSTVTYSTAYTGTKFSGDDSAYDRIHTNEADKTKLLQLWDEAMAEFEEKFQGVLKSVIKVPTASEPSTSEPSAEPSSEPSTGQSFEPSNIRPLSGTTISYSDIDYAFTGRPSSNAQPIPTADVFTIILDVPSNFDSASTSGIHRNLTSFFSNSIIGKWFAYTNKEEAGAYADHAQTFLNAAHSLIHEREKPSRPVIVDPDDVG